MATIGICELANHTDRGGRRGEPDGTSVAGYQERPARPVLAAIDEEELFDHLLTNAPQYVRSMRTAEREIFPWNAWPTP